MVVTFKAHGDGTVRFDYLGNSFTMRNGGGNEPRYVILHGADQSVIAQNDDPRRAVEEVFAIVDDYGVKGRSMLHELRSRFDDYEIRASRAAW